MFKLFHYLQAPWWIIMKEPLHYLLLTGSLYLWTVTCSSVWGPDVRASWLRARRWGCWTGRILCHPVLDSGWCIDKSKWHENYNDSDSKCDCCSSLQADLTHISVLAQSLDHYWSSIFDVLSMLLNTSLQLCLLLAVFRVPVEPFYYTFREFDMIVFAALPARWRILLTWKSSVFLPFSVWLKDVMSLLHLEKLKFVLS